MIQEQNNEEWMSSPLHQPDKSGTYDMSWNIPREE